MKGSTELGSENYKTNSCQENKKKGGKVKNLLQSLRNYLSYANFMGFHFNT